MMANKNTLRLSSALLGVIWAFMLMNFAFAGEPAGNSLESLNVAPVGDKVVLKLGFKSPVAGVPGSFAIANPARIALDFTGVGNGLGRNSQKFDAGLLRSVNAVQVGDRTRVVLNLSQVVSYETKVDGNAVYVELSAIKTAEVGQSSLPKFSPVGYAQNKHAITDVNFRRGKNGEGRILVNLSDAAIGVDINKQGNDLVVDFQKVSIPRDLIRKFDVTDFGTPVNDFGVTRLGDNVRFVIKSGGAWEHQAYQADNQFVIEVKKSVQDPNKLSKGNSVGEYGGDKISLNIQNTPVKQLLQTLGEEFGYNVVMSDSVQGSISLRLQDVPWDQAFDLILEKGGLDKRKRGNVLLVAPKDELLKKEEMELQAQQQISDVEPLRTETFQLNYQKAEAFQKILTDEKQRILSKRGSAVIDARTNTLFIQDTPTRLEELRKIIAKVDVPVRQVLIEARIVIATDDFAKNLGARLGVTDMGTKATQSNRIQGTIGGALGATGYLTGQTDTKASIYTNGTATNEGGTSVNLPASSINGSEPGAFSLTLFNPSKTKFLNLEISALEQDGKGKVVSSPRVMTSDQAEAIIEQGTEIPYQQATSSGATAVQFKKANLSLKVQPQITPDGRVIMSLDINKDEPDTTSVSGAVAIKTKHIKTDVLVENGGTVVIGGIYEESDTKTISRVPFLGDLPYVGFLFRNTKSDYSKTELMVFITPKIIADSLALR